MDKQTANRKRKATDHSICPYGSSCYRKNPDHRKKYHSESISQEIQDKGSEPSASSELQETSNDDIALSENLTEVLSSNDLSDEKPSAKANNTKIKISETVEDVLKSMPDDFFEFWNFCSSVNKANPEEAFAKIGIHLLGVYDLLAKNLPKQKKIVLHTHCRYYYDPPEFQTVISSDDDDLYHIGYFRDDPAEFPSILASNSAKEGPKLTLKGDNIFAAMNVELTKRMKELNSKTASMFSKIQENLQKYARTKKYSLGIESAKTKARNKKVLAKTFHGLGIVVPFKNNVGYRPLPDSNAKLKSILQRIVDAKSKSERLRCEEALDEIITNVHFATDECDFGMGLELGLDLFCFGNSYFHSHIWNILSIAYEYLNRPKYKEILKCHLAKRIRSKPLKSLK